MKGCHRASGGVIVPFLRKHCCAYITHTHTHTHRQTNTHAHKLHINTYLNRHTNTLMQSTIIHALNTHKPHTHTHTQSNTFVHIWTHAQTETHTHTHTHTLTCTAQLYIHPTHSDAYTRTHTIQPLIHTHTSLQSNACLLGVRRLLLLWELVNKTSSCGYTIIGQWNERLLPGGRHTD